MPVRYRCSHCGNVIYEFKGVGQSYTGLISPREFVKLVGYHCPYCKAPLKEPEGDVRKYMYIRPAVPFTRDSLPLFDSSRTTITSTA